MSLGFKVLIISVTAGRGHHEAANNCAEELVSRGIECVTVDLLDRAGRLYYHAVDKGYAISIRRFKLIYGAFFRHAARHKASGHRTPTSVFVRTITARAMRQLLEEYKPNAVLCTHVIGAMAMDELKRRGEQVPPTYGLVTDYDVHPFWEDVPNIQRILIAHPSLISDTRRRGIPDSQVTATGIPVASKFTRPKPQIPQSPFVILLMGGSMGFGAMADTAVTLAAKDGAYVICVCAKNRDAYERLSAANKANIELYGEVSNVDELMDRAHIIVTKPGGLSTTEAASKGLPMVLTTPIPGQEESNAAFLSQQGAAILAGAKQGASRGPTAAECADLLMRDAALYERMAEASRRIVTFDGRADAAGRIADLIESGGQA